MSNHVGVAVCFSNVFEIHVTEFIVRVALCFESVSIFMFRTRFLRLMLVSFKSTASLSMPFQQPNLSRILAMLGANWMPAPTKPRFDAVS